MATSDPIARLAEASQTGTAVCDGASDLTGAADSLVAGASEADGASEAQADTEVVFDASGVVLAGDGFDLAVCMAATAAHERRQLVHLLKLETMVFGSQHLSAPTQNVCSVDRSARRQPHLYPPHSAGFRAFSVSPFVSAFAMAGQMCTPAAVTGGLFSPSPPGNQEWVNGWPNMSSLKPDNSNLRGVYS